MIRSAFERFCPRGGRPTGPSRVGKGARKLKLVDNPFMRLCPPTFPDSSEVNRMRQVLIKGGYGGRIDVAEGEILEIFNVEGQQICDFFAFNASDPTEFLSPA